MNAHQFIKKPSLIWLKTIMIIIFPDMSTYLKESSVWISMRDHSSRLRGHFKLLLNHSSIIYGGRLRVQYSVSTVYACMCVCVHMYNVCTYIFGLLCMHVNVCMYCVCKPNTF